MGIKVVQSSYISSNYLPIAPRFESFTWYFFSPKFDWHATIEFDPKSTKPPKTPQKEETWLVGFVLNVLYSRLSIEYHGREKPFAIEWSRRVLDSVAPPEYRPFANAPWHPMPDQPGFTYRAAAVISYGPKGIELLPDLGQKSQPGTQQNPDITLSDQPGLSVPSLFGSKPLRRVEYLDVFKLWVIAQSPGKQLFALVNSEEYSIVYRATFPIPQFKALPTEPTNWESYAVNGALRRIPDTIPKKDFKPLRLQPGEGSPKPVVSGETANERALKWLEDSGLKS